jgi:tetratricopeptide (TPR) repeat protein
VYESKLSLPPGYSVVAPEGVDLVEPYAEYHATAKFENGVLISSRRLVVKRAEVALDLWESYRDFGKAIYDDEARFIPLNSDHATVAESSGTHVDVDQQFRDATQAMQRGDRTRAQELLEQVIRSDPKYPMAHLNLGSVLMMQNKSTEALAEWHKEQEAHPDSVQAYQIPATYLTYMNRKDEAIQEWRKVLKVDPKNHDAALKLSGLLASETKNADAAAVLEEALKESPDSASFNMALGEAYVKSGQADRGIPYMQKAMQSQSDPQKMDPGMLNDAAYLLAANKTHLDVAKEYAEKAVAELDALSVEAEKSKDPSLTGLTLCTEFPAAWDTLGWVYFQMGDDSRAEDYMYAAWVLGHNGLSGDHLGQIYEKLGKKKQAERAYEQALAAGGMARTTSWGNATPDQPSDYQARHKDLLSHYQKLTGRGEPPAITIKRLPNGEWTKTPSEELKEMMRVKISKRADVSGTAEFDVVFTPGKVEAVRYLKGDDALRAMADGLQTAHYQMVFPAGSGAKIVRRVKLTCHSASGCTAEMQPPGLMTF